MVWAFLIHRLLLFRISVLVANRGKVLQSSVTGLVITESVFLTITCMMLCHVVMWFEETSLVNVTCIDLLNCVLVFVSKDYLCSFCLWVHYFHHDTAHINTGEINMILSMYRKVHRYYEISLELFLPFLTGFSNYLLCC